MDSFDVQRTLVIAPLRVAEDTWSREAEKWDHLKSLRVSKILGTEAQRRKAVEADADVYVINRENVVWLIKNYDWNYDTLVIDELSSFKSSTSQRFKALRKCTPKCDRVIGLTGTPAPNGYLDLWSEIYLLDMGERLGRTITSYRMGYFNDVSRSPSYHLWEIRKGAQERINKKLSDICLSMSSLDYLKMPERIDNVITVKMDDAEKKSYKRMEKEQIFDLDTEESITAFSAAGLMNKLLQLASGFMYDEDKTPHWIHEKKLDALEEIVDCNPGDPILVFYNFIADKDALLQRFPKARVLDTSEDIADWNSGKAPMMIAHPASVGHGLNIQEGGHIVVWYGLPWSLELYQQANGRLYRQGQKSKTVVINHLVTEGTVDEQVLKALKDKDMTQAALLSALKERKKKNGTSRVN